MARDWHAITDVFHAALARNTADRAVFVAEACAHDEELRAEVEALLAAHEEAGSFGNGASSAPAIRQLASGTQLGPYKIDSLIGAGGMGQVYRATDMRLDRVVAVKILGSTLRASPELEARFDREARAISQLTHPHICTLHDVGHHDGMAFLVMEHLDGETLAVRLARPLPLEQALRIAVDIAGALDHAHRNGILHRDLKPGNVMLTRSGAKLLDFGLAKLRAPRTADASAAPARDPETADGTLLGTLPYMSPEQLEGKNVGIPSDIWALGCVIYEMTTGRKPFEGASQASLIAAILERGAPSRFTFGPGTTDSSVWSPDGSRIAFVHSTAAASYEILQQASTGAGRPEVLVPTSNNSKFLSDWSRDGKFVLFNIRSEKTKMDLWVVSTQDDRKATPLLQTPGYDGYASFSPGGDWIAYESDESGRNEIYVQHFPSNGSKFQISSEGGLFPRWSRDGKEIFFRSARRVVVSVPVTAGATFARGQGRTLFENAAFVFSAGALQPSADGQRFLALVTEGEAQVPPLTVITNWQATLKK